MKNFVNIAKPIMDLLKGRTDGKEKIRWSEECETALNELKRQVTSKPILQIFDPERETVLQTDVCSYGIGAVLSQRDPSDGELKPVASTLKHLCSYDSELIALAKAMKHWRKYLFMKRFLVRTDHLNLTSRKITENTTLNPSRLARITDVLNSFDFEIQHVRGVDNPVADILSRCMEQEHVNTLGEELGNLEDSKFWEAQGKDREIKAIRMIIKGERLNEKEYSKKEIERIVRTSRRYCLNENDIVCFKKFNKGRKLKLPVIPESLRNEILKEDHDGQIKGNHMGVARMYSKLANFC